jgi:enamine deaminase RidA (YjgF/YER057c/UK114 family)
LNLCQHYRLILRSDHQGTNHVENRRKTQRAWHDVACAPAASARDDAALPLDPDRWDEGADQRARPHQRDGSIAQPLGKVGREVSPEQAYAAARLTGLAILGSLKRELGDLDRIEAWTRVFGMVNAAPGFNTLPAVINGFSDLILEVFGPEKGAHARSAVGLANFPRHPVEIEGEVEIASR